MRIDGCVCHDDLPLSCSVLIISYAGLAVKYRLSQNMTVYPKSPCTYKDAFWKKQSRNLGKNIVNKL